MPLRKRGDEPESVHDMGEDFIAAENIYPQPASRRTVLRVAVIVTFFIVLVGIGTWIALAHSDDNAQHIDQHSAARDAEHTQTETQIKILTEKAASLAAKLAVVQAKDNAAVCALAVGDLEANAANINAQNKPFIVLVFTFAKNYGCTIPLALTPPK